jgi:hypothetical protein
MTDGLYIVVCCDQSVAEVEIRGDQVAIKPPRDEGLCRVKPPPTDREPDFTDRQMALVNWTRNWVHKHVMGTARAQSRHVSEILWSDHSSWLDVEAANRELQDAVSAALAGVNFNASSATGSLLSRLASFR